MKKLRWPVNAEQHAYMKVRQDQNLSRCQSNPNENWMWKKLSETSYKWTRQAQWGYRLFDFWCHELGIAVEVDGLNHDKNYDSARDAYNFSRSAIIVLRVRNGNEQDAREALLYIELSDRWMKRRELMGLLTEAQKRRMGE